MSQEEVIYSKPTEFRPERFLDKISLDPRNIIFGFGRRYEASRRYFTTQLTFSRRQCPGNELADRSVFLLITNIAATMNITKARDGMGREITPAEDFTTGLVRYATFLFI